MRALILSAVLATCAVLAQAGYGFKWNDEDEQKFRDSYKKYFDKDPVSRYTNNAYTSKPDRNNPLLDFFGNSKPSHEYGNHGKVPEEPQGPVESSSQELSKPSEKIIFKNQDNVNQQDSKITKENIKVQRESDEVILKDRSKEEVTVTKTEKEEVTKDEYAEKEAGVDKNKDYLLVNNNNAYLLHEPDEPPKTNQPNVVYVPNNQPQTNVVPNQPIFNAGYAPNQNIKYVLMYVNGQLVQVPVIVQQNQNGGQYIPQQGGNVIYTVPNKQQYYVQVSNNLQNQGNRQYYLVPNNMVLNPGVNGQYVLSQPRPQYQIPVQNAGNNYQYPIVLNQGQGNPSNVQYVLSPVQYQIPNQQNPVQYQVPNLNPVQNNLPQNVGPNVGPTFVQNQPSSNPGNGDSNYVIQPALSFQNLQSANLAQPVNVQVPNVFPDVNNRNDPRTNNQPTGGPIRSNIDEKKNQPTSLVDRVVVSTKDTHTVEEKVEKKEVKDEDISTEKPKTNADIDQTKDEVIETERSSF